MAGGPVASGGSAPPTRRRRLLALVLGCLLLGGAAFWFWPRQAPPPPPAIDPEGVDPAIVSLVEEMRGEVQRSPRSADSWGRLGMALLANDFGTEARACFDQAARLDRADPRWPYLVGLWLRLQDLPAARDCLQRAADLTSEPVVHLRLAETLRDLGESEKARQEFEKILAQEPNYARAHLGLGQICRDQVQFDEAMRHLRLAADHDATRKAARSMLAEIDRQRGNAQAANEEARRLALLPEDQGWPDPISSEAMAYQTGKKALLERGDHALRTGRVEKAFKDFVQVVTEYPDSDRGWLMLGRCMLAQRRLPEAQEAFRKAIQLAPKTAENYFYAGVALFEQGNAAEAIPNFREATRLNPRYTLAFYNLGHCYRRQEDPKSAIDAFRSAVRLQDSFAEAQVNLGTLLADQGHKAEALQHLKRAVELKPDDPQTRALLERLEASPDRHR